MAGPPNNLSAVVQGDGSVDLTWTNQQSYTQMDIHRKVSGGSYAKIGEVTYPDEFFSDTDTHSPNTTYYWKIVTNVGDSNEDSCTRWTAEPPADTVSMQDAVTVTVAFTITATDSFTIGEATQVQHETEPGEPQNYEVTETDTITMSDTYETAVISGQNWLFYFGSNAGGIHEVGDDYKGDGGADISAYYQTKALDFADQFPELAGTEKTITHVYLDYLDKQECHVNVGVSTDNGVTWTTHSKVIGSGTNRMLTARFDFWVTGRFFIIKLHNASNDRAFQWVRLKIEFESHTEWFGVG